ncbi:MAG: DUF3891 family protein [Solirubrobacteraceae bacterium]
MLVIRRDGRLVLVTQPEHAAVAGTLARHWGSRQFTTPVAHEALICAAEHHDDGWFELDGRPMFNHQQQRPAHFIELPLTDTAAPYARGVESVYERDQHAGVLVSMHFSGFYTSRWGVDGGPPSDNPLALDVVATQEARWMRALRDVWGYRGRRSEFEANNWHAYEILQAVDLMSLALCLMDVERPSAEHPVDVANSLASIDQVAGPRLITGVPGAPGGPYATLQLTVTAPGALKVEPFPFAEPELALLIAVRELEDRRYAGPDEAADAFRAAAVRELSVTITPRR